MGRAALVLRVLRLAHTSPLTARALASFTVSHIQQVYNTFFIDFRVRHTVFPG
jgi:hypothetical protein